MQTETYGLFTNTGLTVSFSGIYDLIHYTDLSDNDTDLGPIYFGSLGSVGGNTDDRQCNAFSDPSVDLITLTITDILPTWTVATAYVIGDCVQPSTPNGKRYICTVAGTSHASVEPTWPTTPMGATVTDNGITWQLKSTKHETSEITLALTSDELETNTPGVALSLGNTVLSGTTNKIPIYIRVTNAVTMVSNNTATPEIALVFNTLLESDV